jgi:hypothetical protein
LTFFSAWELLVSEPDIEQVVDAIFGFFVRIIMWGMIVY